MNPDQTPDTGGSFLRDQVTGELVRVNESIPPTPIVPPENTDEIEKE